MLIFSLSWYIAACGPSEADLKQQEAQTRDYLSSLCDFQTISDPRLDDIPLPRLNMPPYQSDGDDVLLVVDAMQNRIFFRGRELSRLEHEDDLARAIRNELHQMAQIHVQVNVALDIRWVVAVPAPMSFKTVQPLFGALYTNGVREVAVLVDVYDHVQIPAFPAEEGVDELANLPLIGTDDCLLHRLERSCKPLKELIAGLAAVPPEDRCDMIAEHAPKRLLEKECMPHRLAALVLFRRTLIPEHITAVVPLTLQPAANPEAAEFTRRVPWEKWLNERLTGDKTLPVRVFSP